MKLQKCTYFRLICTNSENICTNLMLSFCTRRLIIIRSIGDILSNLTYTVLKLFVSATPTSTMSKEYTEAEVAEVSFL